MKSFFKSDQFRVFPPGRTHTVAPSHLPDHFPNQYENNEIIQTHHIQNFTSSLS